MKKFWLLLFLLTSFLNVYGQDNDLLIKTHPIDIEKATKEINQICNDGYLPIGLDIVENEYILIAYTKNNGLAPFTSWNLRQDKELDNIGKIYSAYLKEGWLAAGFSKTSKAQYVLFLKTNWNFSSWRIMESDSSLEEIENVLRSYVNQGFIPVDLAYFDHKCEYFFVKSDAFLIKNISLRKYKSEGYQNAVANDMKKGLIPWSFMPVEDGFYILYIE